MFVYEACLIARSMFRETEERLPNDFGETEEALYNAEKALEECGEIDVDARKIEPRVPPVPEPQLSPTSQNEGQGGAPIHASATEAFEAGLPVTPDGRVSVIENDPHVIVPPEWCQDVYTWEAVYTGGTSLWETDAEGLVIGKYGDIDRSRLIEFRVYRTDTHCNHNLKGAQPFLRVEIKPGHRLIWRKRRHQRIKDKSPFLTIYLVGWQATIEGKNFQAIYYMFPDGSTELSSKKSDVQLFDFERVDSVLAPGQGVK